MGRVGPFIVAFALAALSASVTVADEAPPRPAPGVLKGYLEKDQIPDSAALLPPPPPPGSAAEALDQQVAKEALALRDTPRWKVAALDADLRNDAAVTAFSCPLGIPINATDTPLTYTMLRRVLIDAGAATGAAKTKYQHARPFMMDYAPICTPDDEKPLRDNGSYPSGHTSIGWAWALTLAEAAPDRSELILKRGLEFGDSRLVCNVHWESDVVEGRVIGSATFAALQTSPDFLSDLAVAKEEIKSVRAKGLPLSRDCAAEAEALAATPEFGP
jgi:acid phosphatase (class A)